MRESPESFSIETVWHEYFAGEKSGEKKMLTVLFYTHKTEVDFIDNVCLNSILFKRNIPRPINKRLAMSKLTATDNMPISK